MLGLKCLTTWRPEVAVPKLRILALLITNSFIILKLAKSTIRGVTLPLYALFYANFSCDCIIVGNEHRYTLIYPYGL